MVTASRSAVQRIRKTTKKQPYESRGMPLGFDRVLAILEEDPRLITALTRDLPAPRLQKAPVLGVWSANDVLAHLRACSDARGECVGRGDIGSDAGVAGARGGQREE